MTLAVEAEGEEITTVEGLMEGEELGPVQQAFLEHDAFQCGYCTPGQVSRRKALESRRLIRSGSNLCRCGLYTFSGRWRGRYRRDADLLPTERCRQEPSQ
jgi:xanthine dehydrogenase YagT iron-sulfur-binding subunit